MKRKAERNFVPTCPLNRRQIEKSVTRQLVVVSALAFAAVCFVAGVVLVLDFVGKEMVSVGTVVVGALGVLANAVLQRTTFERREVRRAIDESNAVQNTTLLRIASEVKTPSYRDCLFRFLELKKRIELAIHQSGELTPSIEKLEELVDEIVDAVCWELRLLDSLDEHLPTTLMQGQPASLTELTTEQSERYERVMRAFETLQETCLRLQLPPVKQEIGRRESLDRASQLEMAILELQAENRIADRILNELPPIGDQK